MNKKQIEEFLKALNSIAEEKKVDKKIVIEAMEQAMAAADKKNEGVSNVEAEVDAESGVIRLYSNRAVVEEVTNPETEISLEEARKIKDDIEVGGTIRGEELMLPNNFGRVAIVFAPNSNSF